MTATVRTASSIAELVGKFPGLGIDTFVPERDYNQAMNELIELRRYKQALYCANGFLIQHGIEPVKLDYSSPSAEVKDG